MPDRSIKAQTLATGMVRPRTTALFFDLLWVHPALMEGNLTGSMNKYAVPRELCIPNPLGARRYYLAYGYNVGWFAWDEKDPRFQDLVPSLELDQISHYVPSRSKLFQDDALSHFGYGQQYADTFGGEASTRFRNMAIRDIADLYAEQDIQITPIFLTPTEYEGSINPVAPGIEVCLDAIPVPLDSELSWKQVLEFRKDTAARDKLNRFRCWFTRELAVKPKAEIQEILAKRTDDYDWALKKHGIKTTIGGSASIISFATGPTLLGLLTTSPLAATLGGVAIAAGAVAWIADRLIDRKDIERNEVAYLHDIHNIPLGPLSRTRKVFGL